MCGRLGSLNASCVQYLEANGAQILYELAHKIVCCLKSLLCMPRVVQPKLKLKHLGSDNSLQQNGFMCNKSRLINTQLNKHS